MSCTIEIEGRTWIDNKIKNIEWGKILSWKLESSTLTVNY